MLGVGVGVDADAVGSGAGAVISSALRITCRCARYYIQSRQNTYSQPVGAGFGQSSSIVLA